ncbi:MAG TPA: YdcF family protein [Solirubrobacteraceae bacterium]|nr:YdcF family protein [Solirubrobacteraceae bacterium]
MARFYPIALLAVGAAATFLRALRSQGDALPDRAPAIVILGCQTFPWGVGTELRARTRRGAALFHAGLAPRIVASGGYSGGTHSEPEAMREELVALGVPAGAVHLDHTGTNTRGTVAAVRRLGLDGAVAVSSPYHLPRIAAEARRQGLALTTTPAPKAGGRRRYLGHALREVPATWWYALTPWLSGRPRRR